jgi:lipopolysaccharide export system protein LptA
MMQFALEQGEVLLQVEVRLFKHTDSGAMVCKCTEIQSHKPDPRIEGKGNHRLGRRPLRGRAHHRRP